MIRRRALPLLFTALSAVTVPSAQDELPLDPEDRAEVDLMRRRGENRAALEFLDDILADAPDDVLTRSDTVNEEIFIVMRVYFEKPRTIVGWKGLLNDPDLDGSYHINKGLRLARRLLVDITNIGLPAGTEFLDTTFGQYYTDLISWGAIGARTAESQIHRELASGLSMPVGIKNRTDGNIQVAIDAIRAASHPHLFPSLTKEGAPAILETRGNPDCHLVLRGGDEPNHSEAHIAAALDALHGAELPQSLMVDCSHGNSQKDATRQPAIALETAGLRRQHAGIRALMVESHLLAGRQDLRGELTYGQSITDACLGFDDTEALLRELAAKS